MTLLASAALTFVASLGLTWAVRRVAQARGWIVMPQADRWHRNPTAMYGGVAIFGAFLVGMLANMLFFGMSWSREVAWLLGGAATVFAVGLIDDRRSLKPATKLVFELIAASAVIAGLGWLIPLTPMLLVNTLLTYFWFIGLTNALNLLDNMDGLTAGIGAIAAAALVAILALTGHADPMQLFMLATLIGALGGFLCFNFSPASIFMGDGGSLFIGYMSAAMAVGATGAASRTPEWFHGPVGALLPLALPVVVLAVPIFDTTLVTVMRKSHGLGAMQGGRDHISHRLVRLGLGERGAVLALYGLGALGGVIGLALTVRPNWAIVGVGFYGLLLALLGIRLGAVPVYADAAVRSPVRVRLQQFIETVLIRWHLPALAADIFLIGSAYYSAFIFRYEDQFVGAPVALYIQTLPLVIPLLLLWFLATGVYQPVWRALSIFDLKRYLLTFSLIPPFLIAGYLLLGYQFSVTMVLVFTLLLGILVVGSRLFFRLVDQWVNERVNASGIAADNVLIYGAGNASRIAAEELLRDPSRGLRIVGLVDDDATLHGRKLWGHTVLGGGADLATLVATHRVKEIIVSSSKIDAQRVAQGVQALPEPPAVSRMTVVFQRIGPARGGAEAPGDAAGPEAGADDGGDTPTSPAARSTGR